MAQTVAVNRSKYEDKQPLKQPRVRSDESPSKRGRQAPKPVRGVFQHPPNSGIWWVNYYVDGKRHREKVGTRKAASDLYSKRKNDARMGVKLPDSLKAKRAILFEELAKDAMEYSKAHKKSHRGDISNLSSLLPVFGKLKAEEITPQTISAYFGTRTDLKPASINRYRSTMSMIFAEGIRNGKVTANPARLVRLRKENNARLRFITFEEEAQIRSIIQRRCPVHEPAFTVAIETGNRSRSEINQRIHDELQSRGLVNKQEHSVRTLVPRQEMTGADRSWAQQYQVDDILRYSRTSKETGIAKGEYSRVLAVNAQANTLTVVRGNGEQTTYDPRRQVGVSVYREDEKKFSVGDRIQFTAPSQELKIANRDLGIVESIGRDGMMRLRLDDERKVEFNPQEHPHVDHGYAVTSYSSQGQTAERVLVNVDTELAAKDLLNSRMAYVSISRGQFDAQIFTDNREKLPKALGHDVSQQSAFKPEQSTALPEPKIVLPKHDVELSMGFGLGL
jgi:hypothetical protein